MNGLHRIRASAGSGKTHRLTGMFLEMLAEAEPPAGTRGAWRRGACGLPPAEGAGRAWSDVMGVTFTNAAAQEMKERVLSGLKGIALGGENSPENLHGWTRETALSAVDDLLRCYDDLNLRTIDSLLHMVVRQAALELDLPPDFETTFNDGDLFGPLIEDMAERAREGGPDGGDKLRDAFAAACEDELAYSDARGFLAGGRVRGRIAELAGWLLSLLDQGNAELLERLLETASSRRMAETLETMLRNILADAAELRELLEKEGLKPTSGLMKALAALPGRLDPSRPAGVKEITSVYLCEERPLDAGPECTARLAALRRDISLAKTARAVFQDARRLAPFLELAFLALNELPERQNAAGLLPASRVPALASRVLSGEYGVAESFCRMGSRLAHVLIDEFQDTSIAQWRAMEPLAREVLARGGSISLIGDVKQSIYHWRGGESSLFEDVPRRLADVLDARGAAPDAPLDCNWRSRRNIIAWNNEVFQSLADTATAGTVLDALVPKSKSYADQEPERLASLESSAELLARAFSDAVQLAPACVPEGGLITLRRLPPRPSRRGGGETADMEAEAEDDALERLLPEKVEEIARRAGAYASICVLTRTTGQSEKAASWLLARGIPVLTQASLLLAEQPVVAQTVALMGFLAAQEDDIAFWTVLEGGELLPPAPAGCWGAGGAPVSRREALRDWAAGLDAERAEGGRRLPLALRFAADFPGLWKFWFAPLTESAGLYTPYDTICGLYRRWKVRERNPGAEGFIRRFLEVLHMAEQQGQGDVGTFLRWWNEKGREEKAPLPKNMDAVRVMSIHRAKGLAFGAVILPWLSFSVGRMPPGAQPPPMVCEAGGLTVLGRRIRALGRPWLDAVMDDAREAMHLFYVACTRAVSELHCFLPPEEETPRGMNAVLERLIGPLLGTMTRNDRGEWIRGEVTAVPDGRNREADAAPALPDMPGAEGREGKGAPCAEPDGTEDDCQEDAWLPMAWLPRLHIFRSPLEEWAGWRAPDDSAAPESIVGNAGGFSLSSRQRGVLAHLCLEMMQAEGGWGITEPGGIRLAVRRAVGRALLRFPLPLRERHELEKELEDMLLWYAALPESEEWLRLGVPEQSLLDGDGRLRRVDLLVESGDGISVVEYKSGSDGTLPVPAHERQLKSYMDALAADADKPVRGALIYLDRKRIFRFDSLSERVRG